MPAVERFSREVDAALMRLGGIPARPFIPQPVKPQDIRDPVAPAAADDRLAQPTGTAEVARDPPSGGLAHVGDAAGSPRPQLKPAPPPRVSPPPAKPGLFDRFLARIGFRS